MIAALILIAVWLLALTWQVWRLSRPPAPVLSTAPVLVEPLPATHVLQLLDAQQSVRHEVSWHQSEIPAVYTYGGHTYRRTSRDRAGVWRFSLVA
jgi:hypothetical protein